MISRTKTLGITALN